MVRGFQILAVVLAVIGAYFVWSEDRDPSFVFLVLAACSYFIGMRFQIKARMAERTSPRSHAEKTED